MSLFLAVNEVENWKKYGRFPSYQASVPSGLCGVSLKKPFSNVTELHITKLN